MNIQDPNQRFDCFACGGKGYFLLWSRLHGRAGEFVTRQKYLASPLLRPTDAYKQIDCGECGGTGVLKIGEVKR